MANEDLFKQRWADDFHGSSEYQNAVRRDAIEKFQREAQGRAAIRAALNRGDARRASEIQRNLAYEAGQENIGAAGNVGAENAFQNQRANDYIRDAEKRGVAAALDARTQPLSGITQSGTYIQGLMNPDFSTFTPNADTSRLHYGEGIRRDTGALRGTTPTQPATPTMDWNARQAAIDRDNLTRATRRHEDHFIASLPPELAKIYPAFQAQQSPQEAKDFLNESPELRYGKLRAFQPRSATPTPLGADSMVMGNRAYNATSKGPQPIGSVGSSDLVFSTPQMPTVKPVANTRPTTELAKPTSDVDYLAPSWGPM